MIRVKLALSILRTLTEHSPTLDVADLQEKDLKYFLDDAGISVALSSDELALIELELRVKAEKVQSEEMERLYYNEFLDEPFRKEPFIAG